jgi:hypothetical protein
MHAGVDRNVDASVDLTGRLLLLVRPERFELPTF